MSSVKILSRFADKVAAFRKTFSVPEQQQILKFSAKHMYISLQQMEAKLHSVDCVIEVHDARIPLSCRNQLFFEKLYAIKPHILVLNKVDLVDHTKLPLYEKVLKSQGVKHVLWTSCAGRSDKDMNRLMDILKWELTKNQRYHRTLHNEYQLMVVGVPNCGKSSLINTLRRFGMNITSGAEVGPRPGVTRKVSRLKISENPEIYLFDTPGITPPGELTIEDLLKMGICELTVEDYIGRRLIADYLLYWLNKNHVFDYVDVLRLKEPTDNILEVLPVLAIRGNMLTAHSCTNFNHSKREQIPDIEQAATMFLKQFRQLKFRKHFLDSDRLSEALGATLSSSSSKTVASCG